jgi:hypothetical protein
VSACTVSFHRLVFARLVEIEHSRDPQGWDCYGQLPIVGCCVFSRFSILTILEEVPAAAGHIFLSVHQEALGDSLS